MAQLDSSTIYGNLKINRDLTASGNITVGPSDSLLSIASSIFKYNNNNVWHAGNMGAGSGLNADTVDTFHASQSNTANNIVVRDNNGYITTGWINCSRADEATTAASYVYDIGDGYLRKKTLANAKTELVTSAAVVAGLGYTPVSKTGDNMTGTLNFYTNTGVRAGGGGNTALVLFSAAGGSVFIRGNGDGGANSELIVGTSSLTYNGSTIYHSGNLTPANYVLKAGDTMSGQLKIAQGVNTPALLLEGATAGWASGLWFNNTTTTTGRKYGVYSSSNGSFNISDETAAAQRFSIDGNGVLYAGATGTNTIWHSGNFTPANKLDTTIPYAGLDNSGSTAYPRMYAINNPCTDSNWIRVGTTNTASGLLPYANNSCYLGTDTWRFNQIHATTFYENGTALSSKYDKYSSWTLKAPSSDGTGIAITSGTSVVITGTGGTTVTRSSSTVSIDTPSMSAIRITFPVGKQTYTWTHNLNWTDYVIQITPNSPETHFYYSSKTVNAITINLDDEAYEQLDVDVIITRLTVATATATA